jgi:hypothetical protein
MTLRGFFLAFLLGLAVGLWVLDRLPPEQLQAPAAPRGVLL